MKRSIILLWLALVLVLATANRAHAWPDRAPDKATISGPGIEGEVAITDAETLNALKLGAAEDFAGGSIPAPKFISAYVVRRWFDGGNFEYGRLTYYPMPRDSRGNQLRGYVFFEDGAQVQGQSPYNRRWFYATAEGDTTLKKLLTRLGVALPDRNVDTPSEPMKEAPAGPGTGASSVTPSQQPPAGPFASAVLAAEILIALIAGAGVLYFLRARAGR